MGRFSETEFSVQPDAGRIRQRDSHFPECLKVVRKSVIYSNMLFDKELFSGYDRPVHAGSKLLKQKNPMCDASLSAGH